MTRDDYALEAIDYNGNAIESLDDYIAGSAGTIRYSNIAQLEVNDCVILCNLAVMEAVGQREMLRLMYEAEDQSDAAGMIMTQASAKNPGEPLQVAIGFVESVIAQERTGKLNLGRFATESVPMQKPMQEQKDPDLARTQRYHSSSMANLLDEQERIYKAGQDAKSKASVASVTGKDAFDEESDTDEISDSTVSSDRRNLIEDMLRVWSLQIDLFRVPVKEQLRRFLLRILIVFRTNNILLLLMIFTVTPETIMKITRTIPTVTGSSTRGLRMADMEEMRVLAEADMCLAGHHPKSRGTADSHLIAGVKIMITASSRKSLPNPGVSSPEGIKHRWIHTIITMIMEIMVIPLKTITLLIIRENETRELFFMLYLVF